MILLFIYNFFRVSQLSDSLIRMSSLREQCKERLKVAFDSVRAVSNTLTFILIVDNYGLKVLSSTIKMMELINYGITIVERLQLKRKKISKVQAVYLIHPNSFGTLLQDFPQDGTPQYKSIHILSLSRIQIAEMQTLTQNTSFAKRVKTLKQINFSFSLHSHNQVKICCNDEKAFDHSLSNNSILLESTVDELATIATAMSTFYIVQIYYQKSSISPFTEKVALGLKQRFQSLFKAYQKFGVQNYNSSAPVTTFLILDRSYDAVSPLIRDFHYQPLFYDLKNVTNHRISDWGKEKKGFVLNDGDQILQKYRNAHIRIALKGIPADFQQFTQNHAAAKFQKTKGEKQMGMNELGEVLKKMPQYLDVKDRYSLHYEVLSQILGNMESKDLKNQGIVEQSTITMTTEEGKKIKDKDVLANLTAQLQKTKDQEERAKLVLIGLMTLELKPKEQNSLTDFLSKTKFEGIEKGIAQVSGPNTYKFNPKKESKTNEMLDRHQTKIEDIVREVSNQNHGDLKHLRVGAAEKSARTTVKNQANLGLKKIKFQAQNKDRPRMIVFVNSALGYNQMRALSEFESSYHMIYASHNFVTQGQYLRLINGLGTEQELQL